MLSRLHATRRRDALSFSYYLFIVLAVMHARMSPSTPLARVSCGPTHRCVSLHQTLSSRPTQLILVSPSLPPPFQLWMQMASRSPPSLTTPLSSTGSAQRPPPIPRARRDPHRLQRLSFSFFMSPPHLLSLFFPWSCREHARSLATANGSGCP